MSRRPEDQRTRMHDDKMTRSFKTTGSKDKRTRTGILKVWGPEEKRTKREGRGLLDLGKIKYRI